MSWLSFWHAHFVGVCVTGLVALYLVGFFAANMVIEVVKHWSRRW